MNMKKVLRGIFNGIFILLFFVSLNAAFMEVIWYLEPRLYKSDFMVCSYAPPNSLYRPLPLYCTLDIPNQLRYKISFFIPFEFCALLLAILSLFVLFFYNFRKNNH